MAGRRAANQSKEFVFFSFTIHYSGVLDISSCHFSFHLYLLYITFFCNYYFFPLSPCLHYSAGDPVGGDHHLIISANTPELVRRCVKALLSYMYRNFGNPSSLLVFNSGATRTSTNFVPFCSAGPVTQVLCIWRKFGENI